MIKTVLNGVHRDLGARLVEFGGFEMPIQYTSIVEEHHTVRRGAGLFDLCHMGRFEFRGEGAAQTLDRLITCGIHDLKVGQVRYGLVTNERGGVQDDVLVYRLADSYWLVVNAGNRKKLLPYFQAERDAGTQFRDRSEELAMIAVQGPDAERLLTPHVRTEKPTELAKLRYYRITPGTVTLAGQTFTGWVSRTGYTGEDGFELYVDSSTATALWYALQESAGEALKPCGLGARDTLRLEAGMPLYGHELGEDIDPFSAGLGFAVQLDKEAPLVGAAALQKIQRAGPQRNLRGYTIEGRRVAREGMKIFSGAREVGVVTSGAPSPTLEQNIAMAYVAADVTPETPLEVEVRGQRFPMKPVKLPFYRR